MRSAGTIGIPFQGNVLCPQVAFRPFHAQSGLYTAPQVADLEQYVRTFEPLAGLQLRRPVALLGFGGWIDAGFAATGAVRYLVDHLPTRRIAELDPEPFYSFTDTRPRV